MKAVLLLLSSLTCGQGMIKLDANIRPDPADCPCPKGTTSLDCSNKSWVQTPMLKDWLQHCWDTLGSLDLSYNKLQFMPFEITEDGQLYNNSENDRSILFSQSFRNLTFLNMRGNSLDSMPPFTRDGPRIFEMINPERIRENFSYQNSTRN